MSTALTPATVKAIAQSVDVTHLSEAAAKALAPDVEYRLREVVQVGEISAARNQATRARLPAA